jgi:hypothetical protein
VESSGGAASTFVLRVDAVRWCIEQIRGQKVHPFFPAYLHLREEAVATDSDSATPHWPQLGQFLEVPGGPSGKPYFRPFWNGSRASGQEWLNENLAGSYAGSSLRAQPLKVISYGGGAFTFPDRHWEAAREHLLYGERLSARAVAGFLYRDFAFQTEGVEPTPDDLVAIFRTDFRYYHPDDEPDSEFEYLFDSGSPDFDGPWFEPYDPHAPESDDG